MTIDVEKLVYGGDGLSRRDGEVILTPFVWSGETAEIELEPKRSGIARGRLTEILAPSLERVTPACPYFGVCGGCHYQQANYAAQLEAKRAILSETLARTGKIHNQPEIQIIAAEPWHYRNRIQLHFEENRVGYREMRSHQLCAINQCPISSPRLNECIQALNRMVKDRRWPSFLRTAELFTNETEVQFNVLETDRPLAQRFFDWCAESLPGFSTGALTYEGYRVSYGSFFQVNRFLIQPLVKEVLSNLQGEIALDLYSGVGLFTIPLANRFAQVTAVESGTAASKDMQYNATQAEPNIEAVTESVDSYLMRQTTTPDAIIADPPRTGLGKTVVRRLAELKTPQLVVVACDPTTLARDAQSLLAAGYVLQSLTLVDLFPQTYHIETIARFRRD